MRFKVSEQAQKPYFVHTHTHTHTQVRFAEHGRSMVEVLGTLAIMGIVALAGMWAYNAGMDSLRASTLMNEAQKRAVVVAGQINMQGRTNPSLSEFTDNTFGGGTFGTEVVTTGLYQQFGIKVSGVSKRVCQNILNTIGDETSLRWLSTSDDPRTPLTDCTDESIFLMIYNNDLSSASGDTKYCQDDSSCQTVCSSCNATTHLCEGECDIPLPIGGCGVDSDCNQNNKCLRCDLSARVCKNECQRLTYLESDGTQYIDTDYRLNDASSFELKLKTTVPFTSMSVFGSRSNSSVNNISVLVDKWGNSGARVMVDFNNASYSTYRAASPYHENVTYMISGNKNLRRVNDTRQTATCNETITTPANAYLFSISGSPVSSTNFTGRIFYCKIWEEDHLKRDFVPVYVPFKTDGKQNCLFDKVSGELFCNAVSGDFITNLNN